MEVKFQKKIKKLFEKRSNLENELYKCHEIILEYIESQSRCSKIDTYIEKCRNYIEQAVEINTELIDMAAKSANPDELIPAQDMWLHKLTQSNDFLHSICGINDFGQVYLVIFQLYKDMAKIYSFGFTFLAL